ncbi:MAG: ribosomal protein [Naasia sp.]|jgi:large subunit ribosomal protein L9|uniref:50S ribosomal protein L9 n=1 Tax=Naasia sp. TaxID=2546198 RepID=UPI00261960E1|nr:50S ribosomal protein L9 [Naasia sp.]MCU1570289.1 ribosomal protein [Naasia sp.]
MSKLILTSEVSGLGAPGDVIDVKPGYARNYLIPSGFAVAWTRGGEKQVQSIKAARSARELATLEEAQHLKQRLEQTPVTLQVKAGQGGRLFGSVSTSDIADAVAAAGLGAIDKRKVEISSAIRSVGSHEATVRLRDDVAATITLTVVAAK